MEKLSFPSIIFRSHMKFLIPVLLSVILVSCGKKESSSSSSSQSENRSEAPVSIDTDGDGMMDHNEILEGTDPYIADIPTFKGEFFKEMTVNLELYNKDNSAYQSLSWDVKNSKLKLSWNEKALNAPMGSIYSDSLLKNYASNNAYKKNTFTFFDYNEGVFSHSSPVLFEESVFEISKKVLEFEKKGFLVNRADVVLLTSFSIKSAQFKYLRNPVFDIYYKSKSREGLIFIESKKIDGTYSFNNQNEIYINFQTNDQKIIYDSIINGGSSLFVKMRDFVVYDNNERYSEILSRVTSKSIPVTLSVPADDKSPAVFETLYVGSNGLGLSLQELLSRAYKKDLLMTSSSIDQIRTYSNRTRTYGESGANENLKWYIGTNGLSENLFKTQFTTKDGISLSYISDKKFDRKPIYTTRNNISNAYKLVQTTKLPLETKNVKIRIVPETYNVPTQMTRVVSRTDCARGTTWRTNDVKYNIFSLGWTDDKKSFFSSALPQYQIVIKNKGKIIISGNIEELRKNRIIDISVSDDKQYGDISFKEGMISNVTDPTSSIEAIVFFEPKLTEITVGETLISTNCQERNEPPHGVDGAAGGGGGGRQGGYQSDFMGASNAQYNGIGTQVVGTNTSADIHVFAY